MAMKKVPAKKTVAKTAASKPKAPKAAAAKTVAKPSAQKGEADEGGVQLWKGGPYWAECNVGATNPKEFGYYFWWGDAVGCRRNAKDDGWASVKKGVFSFTSKRCPIYLKIDSQLRSEGYVDSVGNLEAAHDAATAYLGSPWRMPTEAEFNALDKNCDKKWVSRKGVGGYLVKGRGAYSQKSIFLPAAGYGNGPALGGPGSLGYYWASTYSGSNCAPSLNFNSRKFFMFYKYCYQGYSVRPVRGFAK